jgi:thiol-disulfide isomerase/thioredoxin
MAFVLSLTIGILIVSFFKKLLNAQADSFNSKLQSLRIKRNPVVLASVFGRQKIAEVPKNHNIVMGDSNAPFVITTLLSPMCKPCKKLAGQIIELLKKHPSCFYWQIRFDGIENNAGNLNKIQLQLMQLCNREKDENLKLKIISAWYSRQSFKWFSSKYPFQEISPEIYSSFAEVIIENKKFGFKKVPGLWVNDKELPSDYSVADLPYLTTDFKLFLHLTKQ